MIITDHEQGSLEWFESRLGIPSASGYSKLVTSTGKKASTFDDYCYQLACERITGERTDTFKTPAMERGNELEEEARTAYEFIYEKTVTETGFILDQSKLFGCSPDGLIMVDNGYEHGLEIKCPMAKTHLKYLDKGKLPTEYKAQVHGCMLVTGLEYWDFISYHPQIEMFFIRVERDEEFIRILRNYLLEASERIAQLTTIGEKK